MSNSDKIHFTRGKKRQLEEDSTSQTIEGSPPNKKSKLNNDEKDLTEKIQMEIRKILGISGDDSNGDETFLLENDEFSEEDQILTLQKLKDQDEEAYNTLIKINKVLKDNIPNMVDILKLPMRIKDKAKIMELFEIFSLLPVPSEDWLIFKERINFMIKKYVRDYVNYSEFSDEEIENMKKISKELK